jgi:hypothetical protein
MDQAKTLGIKSIPKGKTVIESQKARQYQQDKAGYKTVLNTPLLSATHSKTICKGVSSVINQASKMILETRV